MHSVPLQITNGGRLVYVIAVANNRLGTEYKLLVDTGVSHVVFLPELLQELQPSEVEFGEQTSPGSPEITQTMIYRLNSLSIKRDDEEWSTLPDVDMIALDWPRQLGVDGILGMTFLAEFSRLCLDFDALTLELHEIP